MTRRNVNQPEKSEMKVRTPLKKKDGKRIPKRPRTTRAKVSQPIALDRKSPVEFTCGVELDRALLVEESLDERERRG
jgi:hypothetical protein